MPAFVDLVGSKFGRWLVIALDQRTKQGARWLCKCDCGVERTVLAGSLRSGRSNSCGCLLRELAAIRIAPLKRKHGLAPANENRHPLFGLWKRMRQRCRDVNCDDFKDYGGRGIAVCERWNDFAAFLEDMGPRPSLRHTLDRIDNDRGYEPDNVRWATPTEQARHKRTNVLTETDVESIRILRAQGRSPRQIAIALGLSPHAVKHVIYDGTWAKEDPKAQAG